MLPPFKYLCYVILRGKEKQHFLLLDHLSGCNNFLSKLTTFWAEKSKNLSRVLLLCFQMSFCVCVEMGLWCPSHRTKRWTLAGRRHLHSAVFLFTQVKIVVDQIWEALGVSEFCLSFMESENVSLGTQDLRPPSSHLRCAFADAEQMRLLISSGRCSLNYIHQCFQEQRMAWSTGLSFVADVFCWLSCKVMTWVRGNQHSVFARQRCM